MYYIQPIGCMKAADYIKYSCIPFLIFCFHLSVQEWKRHLELKINFMQCVMYYYLTLQAEDQQSYGERLAYAHTASKKLAECVKLSQVCSYTRDDMNIQTLVTNGA